MSEKILLSEVEARALRQKQMEIEAMLHSIVKRSGSAKEGGYNLEMSEKFDEWYLVPVKEESVEPTT